MIRRLLLAVLVVAVPAGNAAAHPYEGNQSGAIVHVTDNRGVVLENRDGVFAQAIVAPAMVAATDGTTTWGNVRPIQVAATQPQLSRDNTEFIGIGYGIGCILDADCTGIYKRQYYDGSICSMAWSCAYQAEWRQAVSVGETRTFQIQRKYTGSFFEWRLYFDNSAAYLSLRPQMTNAFVALGSENAQKEGAGHIAATMQQEYRAVYVHGNGSPSTNPPGVTNMSAARGVPFSPHAPSCRASIDTRFANVFRITGSC